MHQNYPNLGQISWRCEIQKKADFLNTWVRFRQILGRAQDEGSESDEIPSRPEQTLVESESRQIDGIPSRPEQIDDRATSRPEQTLVESESRQIDDRATSRLEQIDDRATSRPEQ